MKRITVLVLTVILILMLVPCCLMTGCGESGGEQEDAANDANADYAVNDANADYDDYEGDVSGNTDMPGQEITGPNDGESASGGAPDDALPDAAEADVDLTVLSSTMVYSEVYNIVTNPDEYIGKTIKMHGSFAVYTNEAGDQYYPSVIIADATACCAQGMEFILKGEPLYPDGYPEEGAQITVQGIFETYEEDGIPYCHLVDAVIIDK